MNASNAKDYLPLVQALVDGKVIQTTLDAGRHWNDAESIDFVMSPSWYRIKPEPREVWVNHYPGGAYAYETEDKANRSRIEHGVTRRYREVLE